MSIAFFFFLAQFFRCVLYADVKNLQQFVTQKQLFD